MEPLLAVRDLRIETVGRRGGTAIVDGVSFTVKEGRTLALVGESGAGKSLSALATLGLLPKESLRIAGGSICLEGEELTTVSTRRLRHIRGGVAAMIFQDPLSCLNPVLTVRRQIAEVLKEHTDLRGAALDRRAVELLDLVRIPEAAKRLDDYPHRLSGGMRQRVMIAMALAGNPRLLLADEPTTALDVTISAQIMDLLKQLQEDLRLGILLITHDLPAVRRLAHDVAVMYSGKIVETGPADRIFSTPSHPYTADLLAARPVGSLAAGAPRLKEIQGTVPLPTERPPGCAFGPRCGKSRPDCAEAAPTLHAAAAAGVAVACHHPLARDAAS